MTEKTNQAFAVLDQNKDGFVTVDEIKSVLSSKGVAFDAAKIDAAFKELDKDGDGKLNPTEFGGIAEEPYRSTYLPLFEKLTA